MPLPKIPGREVDPGRGDELRGRVAKLCRMKSKR